MTDSQYIQAFLDNQQEGIYKAYTQMKKPFLAFLHSHFSGLQDTDLEDAYHEAFLRLQQNILTGRLTNEKLYTTLQSYLHSVGYFVAQEMLRKKDKEWLVDEENIPQDIEADVQEDAQTRERNQIIWNCVMAMQAPCAPILLGFYWDNLSMEQLAIKLDYANADSVKNQKARCMKKLKTYINSQLCEYGYGK